EPEVVETFQATVAALAVSPAGELAVGLETGKLYIDGKEIALPKTLKCITALGFAPSGVLSIADGSAVHSPSEWAADLMEKGASGSLWVREPHGGAFREIVSGVAYPYGLHCQGEEFVVSESWRHRLVRFDKRGKRATVVDHLPGYPAR